MNDIFKGKILRPIDNQTTGVVIRNIEARPETNTVSINCRYFNLNKSEEGMSEIDNFELPMLEFLSGFLWLSNADTIKSFTQAEWEPLEVYVANWLKQKGV